MAAELSSFPQFPRLSAPVRHEIWRMAASSSSGPGPSAPGVCIFSETWESARSRKEKAQLIVHEPYNRTLLQTNSEAHDIAMTTPGPTRDYDPATDILYIAQDSFDYFSGGACGFGGPEWVTEIRHLALPLAVSGSGMSLPIALKRLSSLKTLSIVFPAASGTLDCFQEVMIPEDPSMSCLRRLTKAELDAVAIEADYTYGMWAGDFPAQWTRTGSDYLRYNVEGRLNDDCDPNRKGYADVSPLWDARAKRLRIKYVGRCVAPLPVRDKFHL
ncbi:hypothetical protein VTK26DRAFT_2925 [Humicola hyalothermophila]